MHTATTLLAAALAPAALAETPLLETAALDFDDAAPAPIYFAEAGPGQTVTANGITVDGGVLLGADAYGAAAHTDSQPNIYASWFNGPHQHSTISIDIDLGALSVTGLLFNGTPERVVYDVIALDRLGNTVDTDVFSTNRFNNNTANAFELVAASGFNHITRVEITPRNYAEFHNFAIDDIEVTRAVPAPGAAAALGLTGAFAARRRR